ncbi:LuxR C-terminal-related transcriptional regulator [Bradyrhizobium sp. 2S1]
MVVVTEEQISWPYDLSLREIQVLHLVATGASNPQIAQQMFVSPRTDRSSDRARLKRILPTASPRLQIGGRLKLLMALSAHKTRENTLLQGAYCQGVAIFHHTRGRNSRSTVESAWVERASTTDRANAGRPSAPLGIAADCSRATQNTHSPESTKIPRAKQHSGVSSRTIISRCCSLPQ